MSTAPCEKGLLAPNQVIDMEDGSSSQADAGNLGSYFDVTFVPTRMSASPTEDADKEKNVPQETVQVRNLLCNFREGDYLD